MQSIKQYNPVYVNHFWCDGSGLHGLLIKIANRIILLFTFLLIAGKAAAQKQISISGQLKTDSTATGRKHKKPEVIGLISSQMNTLIKQSLVNTDGTFSFSIDKKNIQLGEYKLMLLSAGDEQFKSYYQFVITDSVYDYRLGMIRLDAKAVELKEVKIISKAPLYSRKLDKLVVNIEKSMLANGTSALELLQKMPGVNIDVSGNISVNGKDGVMIMVDGKGSYVQKEQIQSLLSTLKSDGIKELEIIANPSAKFDANQGSVINIITKKNSAFSDVHINYSVPLYPVKGVTALNYPTISAGTNLKYKFDKLLSNLSVDYTSANGFGNQTIDSTFFPNLNYARRGQSQSYYQQRQVSVIAGLTYTLSKKASISLDYLLNLNFKSVGQADGGINFLTPSKTLDSLTAYHSSSDNSKFRTQAVTLHYGVDLKENGKEHLDLFYDYNDYYAPLFSQSQTSTTDFLTATQSGYDFNARRFYKIRQHSFKADYKKNILKSTVLYAGVKYARSNSSDSTAAFDYMPVVTPLSAGRFRYTESILGEYLMLSASLGKLEGQVGVRSEWTTSNGMTATQDDLGRQNYLNLFPSLNLLYNFNDKSKLSYSFNRRIVRVSFNDFNPINRYVSPFQITTGEVDLKPQFINYNEIAYQYGDLYVSLNRADAKNPRFDIPLVTQNAALITRQFQNIKKRYSNQLNISYPYAFAKWWNSYNNFTVTQAGYYLPDNLKVTNTAFNFMSSQDFTTGERTSLELSAFYNSNSKSFYTTTKDMLNISLGMKTSFMANRLTLSVNVSDILGTSRYHTYSDYGTQVTKFESLRNNRGVSVGLKYNFHSGRAFNRSKTNSKNDFGEKRN